VNMKSGSSAASNLPDGVTVDTVGTLATRGEEVAGETTMCTVAYPGQADDFSVACSEIELETASDMKGIIALIVNYINIDMFNALVSLHHADVELLSECDPCDADDSRNCDNTDSMHKCARQRTCGLVYWGKTANTAMKLWSNAESDISSGSGYHGEMGDGYGNGDGAGQRTAVHTPSREQELWHLRDRTASLRKVHKTCVNTNKNTDQQNDLSCRRYNRYRGAKGPAADDTRPDTSVTGTDIQDILDKGPRNIYEQVGLSITATALRTAYTTDTLCSRGDYDQTSIFWTTCCAASWAATTTCNTLGQADDGGGCRVDPCPMEIAGWEFASYTPVIDGEASVNSYPVTSQTEGTSVYPVCATEAGSLWRKVTSSESDQEVYWRVDGRKYDNWLEGDLSKQMIMAEDKEARDVMEVCLEAVNLWFHPLYHYYIKCTHNDFHSDFETCKDEQNAYEKQACAWREQEDKFCDEYEDCIDDQCSECSRPDSELCSSIATKVAARKADYETGQRIICLLSVLIDEHGCSGDFCKDQQTDADGNKIAAVDAAATTYANKTVRLQKCKDKGTNDNDAYRYLNAGPAGVAAGLLPECIPRRGEVFADNYKLLTNNVSVNAVDSAGNSVEASAAGAIETVTVGVTDGATANSLDSTLDAEKNSEASFMSNNCVIDTEQWDLKCDRGGGPTPCPEAKYPYTFCVVDNKILLDDTELTLTYGCGTVVDRSHGSSVPSYYVDDHNTTSDTFVVPCSADFFMNDYWGYVKSDEGACVSTSAPDTCAQTSFEPTLSLDDTAKDQGEAGGVPLHWKMFPRPSIMQRQNGIRPADAWDRVDCLGSSSGAGCKTIKVHANYFGQSVNAASVWAPQADSTFNYVSAAGPSGRASGLPYAPATAVVSATIDSFADAFEIYTASPQPSQYSAYPDHFSYRWCQKCLSANLALSYNSDDDTWSWRVSGKTLNSNFAGNCEGRTLTDMDIYETRSRPTGDDVTYAHTPFTERMPAYHPTSCADEVSS